MGVGSGGDYVHVDAYSAMELCDTSSELNAGFSFGMELAGSKGNSKKHEHPWLFVGVSVILKRFGSTRSATKKTCFLNAWFQENAIPECWPEPL